MCHCIMTTFVFLTNVCTVGGGHLHLQGINLEFLPEEENEEYTISYVSAYP